MSFATRRWISNATLAVASVVSPAVATWAAPPNYSIYNLGIVGMTDSGSQGNRVSATGVATGRSLGNPTRAFTWTQAGGLVGLPNLAMPARAFSVGNGVNDLGVVVGTGSTTAFGSNPLPLVWQGGVVSQLPLPMGQTLGRANDVNASNVAVGSVGSGSSEFAAIYAGGTGTIITQTAPDGSFLRTAFSIDDAGFIVGQGIDPNNAARNVGLLYDSNTNSMLEVGALPGLNGALAFDTNGGHVVGSSMMNQGSGLPFIWTSGGGMQPIPLPTGTSQGSARGVNANGWAVGTASSAFAIPFLYDGTATYRLQDLLPPASGWDLAMNTSSSALSINDDGIIVGTGVFNGAVRAYAMIPDEPVPVFLEEFAAAGHEDGIELHWRFSAASDVVDVQVERAGDAAGPWALVDVVTGADGTAWRALDTSAEVGVTYFYRLRVRDFDGAITIAGLVSAQRDVAMLRVALGAPAPNPATDHITVALRLPAAQHVHLDVVDVRGRVIRNLIDGRIDAGEHRATWNIRGEQAGELPAGTYFIRLRTASGIRTQRVTLLR